jgi:hypothetical protein
MPFPKLSLQIESSRSLLTLAMLMGQVAYWYNTSFQCRNPTLGLSVRMQFTLPKVRKWSPLGLSKTQKTIWGVKSPHLGVFFISMKSSWSVDAQNGLACAIWNLQPKLWAKEGPGVKLPVWLPTTKSRESTSSRRRLKECDTALERSRRELQFGLDLVPIQVWGEELWPSKVSGLQPGTVSGLQLGSLGKKSHLDVASAESCRVYYMGEGGGFPQLRAVVSLVCQGARGLSQHLKVFPNVN